MLAPRQLLPRNRPPKSQLPFPILAAVIAGAFFGANLGTRLMRDGQRSVTYVGKRIILCVRVP